MNLRGSLSCAGAFPLPCPLDAFSRPHSAGESGAVLARRIQLVYTPTVGYRTSTPISPVTRSTTRSWIRLTSSLLSDLHTETPESVSAVRGA